MAFHESQLQAIHHQEGPMMVLAGPGSGKTTVITHRVKYLVEQCGVEPGSILVITFTKAAAQEMRQRFEKLTEGRRLPVSFGTFHAVFFAILKRAYRYDASNIAQDEQRTRIIRELVDKLQMDVEDEAEFTSQILSEISLVKGEMMNLDYYYSKNCSKSCTRATRRPWWTKDFWISMTCWYSVTSCSPSARTSWRRGRISTSTS